VDVWPKLISRQKSFRFESGRHHFRLSDDGKLILGLRTPPTAPYTHDACTSIPNFAHPRSPARQTWRVHLARHPSFLPFQIVHAADPRDHGWCGGASRNHCAAQLLSLAALCRAVRPIHSTAAPTTQEYKPTRHVARGQLWPPHVLGAGADHPRAAPLQKPQPRGRAQPVR
jgi:hypothetical protein